MKFRFKYLFVALVFILGINSVSAKEFETDEIDRNTYVIGTHMFTRETNDNYDGQLTIKLIMLAAKTIEGNDLDDMVIYYKNARGNWIDGVSGNAVNVPETFEISHTNIEKELDKPEIEANFLGKNLDTGVVAYALRLSAISDEIEVYKSTEENGEYTLEKTLTSEEYNLNKSIIDMDNDFGGIIINLTSDEYSAGAYYKVRLKSGTKYSDYSNIVEIQETLPTPTISYELAGYIENTDRAQIWIKFEEYPSYGYELYESDTIDGEYTLKKSGEITPVNENNILVAQIQDTVGEHHYYKIRLYITYGVDSEKIYGDFSNILDVYVEPQN